MKYELMQIVNRMKDSLSELDERGVSHHLITEIYDSVCEMEEIIEDDDNSAFNAFNEDFD